MYGIEVRESGGATVVGLWGEFDAFSMDDLRGILSEVSELRGPMLVDLSGVTFLDLQSARELALRSLLYSQSLSFGNPSAEALASIRSLGLEGWIRILPDAGRGEPSLFSGVS